MNRCQLYLEPAAWDFEERNQNQGSTLGAHMTLWKQRAKGHSIGCWQAGAALGWEMRGMLGPEALLGR